MKHKKYELATTHTCRRSFCTNLRKAGISEPDIMRLSGHKTIVSFHKYIKTTNEENAVMLSSNPYFSKPKLNECSNSVSLDLI